MNGYVGTPEGCDLARGADELGPEEGGTCGGKGKVRPTEGHSLLEAREEARPERRRDVATQGKSNVVRGADAWKERGRARGTYYLKTPERGTHQDTERE